MVPCTNNSLVSTDPSSDSEQLRRQTSLAKTNYNVSGDPVVVVVGIFPFKDRVFQAEEKSWKNEIGSGLSL